MKIENVLINKVDANWRNRRGGKPKGHAKVTFEFDTDDMTILAFLDSIYGQTVAIDFGVPADHGDNAVGTIPTADQEAPDATER